jgi:putative hydrolase of the HAD superfamily
MEKWVFFDVGFTLIDETRCYEEHVTQCTQKLALMGIHVTPEEYYGQMIQASKLAKPEWSYTGERRYPDTISTLEQLASRYHLGIIANQGTGLVERLVAHDIAHYFDLIISSAEIGMKKPSPDIFTYALQQAHVSAQECLYIGDRCDNDIIPAKKLGFTTIRVRQGLGQYQPENELFHSDYTVSQLSELLEIL